MKSTFIRSSARMKTPVALIKGLRRTLRVKRRWERAISKTVWA
jgi:hypothetical protein